MNEYIYLDDMLRWAADELHGALLEVSSLPLPGSDNAGLLQEKGPAWVSKLGDALRIYNKAKAEFEAYRALELDGKLPKAGVVIRDVVGVDYAVTAAGKPGVNPTSHYPSVTATISVKRLLKSGKVSQGQGYDRVGYAEYRRRYTVVRIMDTAEAAKAIRY